VLAIACKARTICPLIILSPCCAVRCCRVLYCMYTVRTPYHT
jgi:hypothetical protein